MTAWRSLPKALLFSIYIMFVCLSLSSGGPMNSKTCTSHVRQDFPETKRCLTELMCCNKWPPILINAHHSWSLDSFESREISWSVFFFNFYLLYSFVNWVYVTNSPFIRKGGRFLAQVECVGFRKGLNFFCFQLNSYNITVILLNFIWNFGQCE